MVVMMPRERWTDERLDEAFARVDGEIHELRMEMRRGFEQIDKRFVQIDKRFEKVDDKFDLLHQRFDSMHRGMTLGFVTLFASIVAGQIVFA